MILALSLLMAHLLTSCLSRKEVQAEIWQNSGIPEDICKVNSGLDKYGLYRKLDSGKYEFISYCAQILDDTGKTVPAAQGYLSINSKKFNGFLDDLLPEAKP